MQGSFRLLHELLCTSAQDDGASLGLGTSIEEVKPFSANLLLFELFAVAKGQIVEVVNSGLNGAATSLHCSLQILIRNTTSAEHSSVSKILRNIYISMGTGTELFRSGQKN